MAYTASTALQTVAATATGKLGPALLAAAFGVLILFVVGFAQPAAVHDAAHDTRHAVAFPCH